MSDAPLAIIIRTAGTNCDAEMVRAFELAGARAQRVHIDRLTADPALLDSADLIGFPGGFSYGDDIASGRVLAVKVRERLRERLHSAVERGAPIIGVCNGFQALVQIGLLPGRGSEASRHQGIKAEGSEPQASMPRTLDPSMSSSQSVALADNITNRFIDDWLPVEAPESRCIWTRDLWPEHDPRSADALQLPIAHGEGRFVAASDAVLRALESNNQIALRYSDNVNGSQNAIAGICDETGLVFGLMPHPERYASWTQHPYWTRLDRDLFDRPTPGLKMFANAVEHVRSGAAVMSR